MDLAVLARLVPPTLRPLAKRFYVRSLPAQRRRVLLARRMRAQASWCASLGSPMYASLLTDTATDIERAGICWELLGGREPTPYGVDDALPLRFMGAVHRLVLEGRAPELAPYYPSVGGDSSRDGMHGTFRRAVAANSGALPGIIDQPVQTNEVGRTAVLVPGFLVVARTTGLPLRVLELGASAGLNLRWDYYRYEADGLGWGPPTSAVRFRDVYAEGLPPFDVAAEVVERRGCDLSPLDPRSPDDRLTLLSYVWPDQIERIATLRGAFEIAARVPAEVESGDAVEWAETKLASAAPGVATVVFHSLMLQYVPAAGRARLEQVLHEAGRNASSAAPLAWLRMEWGAKDVELRLRTWPENDDRLLATGGHHGRDIHWLAETD